MTPTLFSLVIPLWNEERNIAALVEMLGRSRYFAIPAQAEAILVNNGSLDQTGALLDEAAARHSWVRPLHLPRNKNYGGGIYIGCGRARADHIAIIPGDLQYLEGDLDRIVDRYFELAARQTKPRQLVKGHRTVRRDAESFRWISRTYTFLANLILGIRVRDINGLPKMFHRDLLSLIPAGRMETFVFDAQLLFVAQRDGWIIDEVPVTFHARRAGVSSWSGKRIRVYVRSLLQLLQVRCQARDPGVPLRAASEDPPRKK